MAFQQKLQLYWAGPRFSLQTISSSAELEEVVALRQICFPQKGSRTPFDLTCDHLVVRDLQTGQLCGAYRVACTKFCRHFETAEDFNLHSLLAKPGEKLELAWACIHPRYRDGSVLKILWRGIAQLIRETKAQAVFGVTSLFEGDEARILEIQKLLALKKPEKRRLRKVLPALLRGYLLAGAVVWTQPFYDDKMDCYDFMTIWESDACSSLIENHFRL